MISKSHEAIGIPYGVKMYKIAGGEEKQFVFITSYVTVFNRLLPTE